MPLNLRAAVLHVNTAAAHTRSPTMRIASFAAEELGVPLVHDVASANSKLNELKKHKTQLDVLFVKFGMLKFSEHREQALELYSRAKLVINLENDYTFRPDPRFIRIQSPMANWGTVRRTPPLPQDQHVFQDQYVNWNVLTWFVPNAWTRPQGFEFPPAPLNQLLYYGAYREDRVVYFKKYFVDAPYHLVISTFRGKKKFQALIGDSERVRYCGAFRDPSFIRGSRATIYVEDVTSHNLYTSPGNRFYECLQLGIAQFFDESCIPTFREAGFRINPWVVYNKKSLYTAMKHYDSVRSMQRQMWWRNYAADLRKQLRSAARLAFGSKCGV